VRGFNEDEVVHLAALAREHDIEMRFIEFMPLDSGRAWDPSKLVPAAEIVDRISEVYPLVALGRDDPSSTSLSYSFADGAPGRIGLIASVTKPFCGECSRLRITADGKVRPCLFSLQEWDLRPLLRGGATDEEVGNFLIDVTWTKQKGHGISSPEFTQPQRPMSAIGG
jgi:GTP 3',8-cyclase